jgi:hypothetical protein
VGSFQVIKGNAETAEARRRVNGGVPVTFPVSIYIEKQCFLSALSAFLSFSLRFHEIFVIFPGTLK